MSGAERSDQEAAELESYAEQEQRSMGGTAAAEEERREADRVQDRDHEARPDPLSAPSGEPHERSRASEHGDPSDDPERE